jgi:hypothetical protein
MRPAGARTAGRDGGGRGSPTARHSAPDQLSAVCPSVLLPFLLPFLLSIAVAGWRDKLPAMFTVTSEWIKATTASSPGHETNDAMELRSNKKRRLLLYSYQHYTTKKRESNSQIGRGASRNLQQPLYCAVHPPISLLSLKPAYYILLLLSHNDIPYQQQDDGSSIGSAHDMDHPHQS